MSRAFWNGFLRGLSDLRPPLLAFAVVVPIAYLKGAPVWWVWAAASSICWAVVVAWLVKRFAVKEEE